MRRSLNALMALALASARDPMGARAGGVSRAPELGTLLPVLRSRRGAAAKPAPQRRGLQHVTSALFGAGMVLGSLGLKLPQIALLLRTRSTAGLSLAGCYGEVPMCASFAIYHARLGYPLDTYAENLVITAQNLAIVAIFWWLEPPPLAHMLGVSALGLGLHLLLWVLPARYQPLVAQAQPLAMLWGYLPQILLNSRLGCTGSLSAATTALRFAGCSIRLLTTLCRIGRDVPLLAAYGLAATCTGTMLAQLALLPAACAGAPAG